MSAAGPPVLTSPGPQMRGRHALALLTKMGMTETVARGLEDFVALAGRAGRDRDWRRHLAAETAARRAAIYDDAAPLRDRERFIGEALAEAERARAGRSLTRPGSRPRGRCPG